MAQRKISELPSLSTPDGAEELVVNDSGVSKKVTIANAVANTTPKIHTHTVSNITDAGNTAGLDLGTISGTVSEGDHAHTGIYEAADVTILKDADIGVNVQAYDATIVVDADIGVNVQAYDATILKDADIGVNVQAYDATIVVDADIGVNVQAYDATIVKDADIGVTVQAYDADTTKNDVANTFTATQTLKGITETEATSSASTYTIDLALGTLFEVTHASLCTVTMPTAAAGKAFTVIATVPAAWSGTILWSGGAAPTTGSAKTIYSFISNGSSWYGMQAGTGFA